MKKICKKCNKPIETKEKGVTWTTFEGKKELEVIHWHFKCFEEWRDASLENRARRIYNDTMKAIVPQFKSMMNDVRRLE